MVELNNFKGFGMDANEIAECTIKSTMSYKKDFAWNELAAASIFHDICDRRGFKDMFLSVDDDTLAEMMTVWSIIIEKLNNSKSIN